MHGDWLMVNYQSTAINFIKGLAIAIETAGLYRENGNSSIITFDLPT